MPLFENTIANGEEQPKAQKKRAEEQKLHEDPQSIKRMYHIVEQNNKRLYFEDHKVRKRPVVGGYSEKRAAFTADSSSIRSTRKDSTTIKAMLDVAAAKGWQKLNVRGTHDFKQEAWLQAEMRGMQVVGYKPTEIDKQQVEKRRAEQAQATAPQPKQQKQAAPPPAPANQISQKTEQKQKQEEKQQQAPVQAAAAA
jgi:hypothetical protein